MALCVDRARKRLLRGVNNLRTTGVVSDLDLNDLKEAPILKGKWNFGAFDDEGCLFVSGLGKNSLGGNGVVNRFGPDGSLRQANVIELFQGLGGLGRDSRGCLYVMDTCRGGFYDVSHDLGNPVKNLAWKRDGKLIGIQSDLAYLVKFLPGGGKRGGESELWAHRGASPVHSTCQCPVLSNTVSIDQADRIFVTDYQRHHVKVLDTAGNLIARIGTWGNADCRGPESKFPRPAIAFHWLHSIDTWNDFPYASDKDLRRIVKIRMDHREVKEAPVP
jgi:hypothetical protein